MIKISNTELLENADIKRILRETMIERKTGYFAHVARRSRYEIFRLITRGKINGKRGPGKRITK